MFGCFYKNELENKMPGMTIENIAAACEGTFVGDRDLVTKEIAGAVTDSRQVQKDYLFIPIKGARVDGHDFIPQVFEKGALVVLSDHALPEETGHYILVSSTTEAMKKLQLFTGHSYPVKWLELREVSEKQAPRNDSFRFGTAV